MFDAVTAKTAGLAELTARFRTIREKIAASDDAIMSQNANEFAKAAEVSAPKGETGKLRTTIRVIHPKRGVYRIVAGGRATTKRVKKGPKPFFDYARADEFGTQDTPASPFFWPNYRSRRLKFRRRINAGRKRIIKGQW